MHLKVYHVHNIISHKLHIYVHKAKLLISNKEKYMDIRSYMHIENLTPGIRKVWVLVELAVFASFAKLSTINFT